MSKIPSENKQISFANTVNSIDISPIGLRPAHISIDMRNGVGDLTVPDMIGGGTFIKQPRSPIKSYALRNLEPAKVADYRALSASHLNTKKD